MSPTQASAGLQRQSRYIVQLESIRGWAILLVVAFHFFGILTGDEGQGLPENSPIWLRILGAGNTGVTLFFVLSGFLLSKPFIEAVRTGERLSIGSYYVARLLRIIPLYYAAVLLAGFVTSNPVSTLKSLLFIPVGFQMFPYSVPWWTLSTEMQFYLLLPWLMLAMQWRAGRWLVTAAAILWLASHCIYFLNPQLLGWSRVPWLESTLFGRGVAFLVGGLCSWFYLGRGFFHMANHPRVTGLVAIGMLIALLALMQWYGLVGQKPALRNMPLYHDLEALLWGALLLCSLVPLGRLGKLFINPLIGHFGTISYSLYLVHVPIQFYLIYPAKVAAGGALLSDGRVLLAVVASFLLSWLAAVLCYRLIERPCLKLKTHLPRLTVRFRGRPSIV